MSLICQVQLKTQSKLHRYRSHDSPYVCVCVYMFVFISSRLNLFMFYIQWMLQIPGATSYMGCIGKDKFGEEMKKNSKLAGVNVSVPCLLILLYSFLIRLSCPDLVIQWWSIVYLSFHVGSLLWGWVCPNRHMCCLCHGRWKVGFYMRILYSFFFTSVLLVDLIWWNAASVPICLIYQFLMQVKYQISI